MTLDTATAGVAYTSAGLTVVRAPSAAAGGIVAELLGAGPCRYVLAGAGPTGWAPWAAGRSAGSRPRTARALAAGFLRHREERAASVDRETGAIESWFAGAGDGARLVIEVCGPPSADDVHFWRSCRLRLGPVDGPPRPMIMVLHEPPAEEAVQGVPGDGQAGEILTALWLAGGGTTAGELARWSTARGWDGGLVAALTSGRDAPGGALATFAGVAVRLRAGRVSRETARPAVAELAGLVAAGDRRVPLGTLALVDRPGTALAGFDPVVAAAGGRDGLARFARHLNRGARSDGWTAVDRPTAATAYLAAIVAGRTRMSPAAAGLVVRTAERLDVAPGARALLAYHLGQLLVGRPDADAQAAATRCFEHVRACGEADPAADRSQTAASLNGQALGRYRHGDGPGAERAMRAALDALADDHDDESVSQQVLLLTNLAKVHRQDPATRPESLSRSRLAWRIAGRARSTAGQSYVGPDLVRALLDAGAREEADDVVTELLRHHDATGTTTRQAEQAVAAGCWRLADADLALGDVRGAAGWYVAAARRCRRHGEAVLDAIVRNLRRHGEPPPDALAYLEAARAARARTAADLAALGDPYDVHPGGGRG